VLLGRDFCAVAGIALCIVLPRYSARRSSWSISSDWTKGYRCGAEMDRVRFASLIHMRVGVPPTREVLPATSRRDQMPCRRRATARHAQRTAGLTLKPRERPTIMPRNEKRACAVTEIRPLTQLTLTGSRPSDSHTDANKRQSSHHHFVAKMVTRPGLWFTKS
jgi:hypothetical protein